MAGITLLLTVRVKILFQKFDDYVATKMPVNYRMSSPAVRIYNCVASYWMHITDVLLDYYY